MVEGATSVSHILLQADLGMDANAWITMQFSNEYAQNLSFKNLHLSPIPIVNTKFPAV